MVPYTVVRFPVSERRRLRELVESLKLRAPGVLGASPASLSRAIAGLPIRYGTGLAIKEGMSRLTEK
jgi:hypothetical protein